jgi:hypothetical protein
MPYLRESSSSPASGSEAAGFTQYGQRIVNDDAYAANSFPGYSEKPLSEQLEPIAVVGMGKFTIQTFTSRF